MATLDKDKAKARDAKSDPKVTKSDDLKTLPSRKSKKSSARRRTG